MSKHYCPAGKCKCENYHPANRIGGTPRRCEPKNDDGYLELTKMEVCPWPSRQIHRAPDLSKIMGAIPDMPEYEKQDPFKSGQLNALQRAREEVESLGAYCYQCKKKTLGADDVLSAIERVEKEVGK